MPTPPYIAITDPELVPGAPLTTSLMTRLRDNPESVRAGGSGAPPVLRSAIGVSGSAIDGAWNDATTFPGPGFFEPDSIAVTTSLALPNVGIIRVNGDVSLAAAATLDVGNVTSAADKALAALLGCYLGNDGADSTGGGVGLNSAGGGGCIGRGGDNWNGGWVGGAAQPLGSAFRFWNRMRPFVGGLSGIKTGSGEQRGYGGGALLLLINGNLTCGAGSKIRANGSRRFGAGVDRTGGGGAGGSVIVFCAGTVTGALALEAIGADGDDHANGTDWGGAGAGGYLALIGSNFVGTPTYNVACGKVNNGGSVSPNASAGQSEQVTLTTAQIRSLLLRSY